MSRIKSRISGVVVLAMWVLIVLILSMSFSLNDAMFAFAVEDIQSLNEATAHVAEEFEDDNVIVVLDPKIL